MPSPDLIHEVERQLTVCNACRYCEGYCAVFPAMELQRTFDEKDVIHLANLCFDCRACYYACPYIPPHDYAINLPEKFAEVRLETYQEYSSPRLLSKLLRATRCASASTLALAAIVFLLALVIQGPGVMFDTDSSEGSFFRIVPYWRWSCPRSCCRVGGSACWRWARCASGARRRVRRAVSTRRRSGRHEGRLRARVPQRRRRRLRLPGPTKSMRLVIHHLLVCGVLLDFASTTVAAMDHNFLNNDPPYGYLSIPVGAGMGRHDRHRRGGAAVAEAGPRPREPEHAEARLRLPPAPHRRGVTGLALMALRTTAAQGTLLTLHLGVIAALFLALPYGKFAHVVYRYAALVRYHVEMSREQPRSAGH